MIWFWLSLCAAAIWGLGNIIDKHIVEKLVKNPLAIMMLVTPLYFISALLIYFIYLNTITIYLVYPFLLGVLNAVSVLLYYKAMKIDEASRVVALIYTSPIFVLIFASIFLSERFAFFQYIGILLIVIGAVQISVRRIEKILRLTPAFFLAIISAMLWGAIDTGQKWSLGIQTYFQVVMGIFLGYAFSVIFLWFSKKNRRDFFKLLRSRRGILAVLMSFTLAVIAWFLYLYALTSGPVSLIAALLATQPLFVLAYVVFLSLFVPKILREEVGRGTLFVKIIAITLIVVGAFLIR